MEVGLNGCAVRGKVRGVTLQESQPRRMFDNGLITRRGPTKKESAMSSSVAQPPRVKQQVIQDMQLAGLAPATQKVYLEIIVRFVRQTGVRPQDASEAQVAQYLHEMVKRGLCHGTIVPTRYALQFIFQNTLGRDWGLFKKESPRRDASVCPGLRGRRKLAA